MSLLIETNDKDKEYYISLAIPENYNLTYEINIIGAFEKLCPFNCSEKGKCVEVRFFFLYERVYVYVISRIYIMIVLLKGLI